VGVKVLATPVEPVADYTVMAVSETGKIYFAEATDAAGSFEVVGLPSDEAYYLEILNDQNQLVAPVAFGTSDDKAVMAIKSETQGDVDLGALVYDESKNCAAPTQEPAAILDTEEKAEVKSGEVLVPTGAGNLGKGEETQLSGTYDSNKVDGDQDGLPDAVDADNNGDLILDEMDGAFSNEAAATEAGSNIEYAYTFTNLKLESYGDTDSFVNDFSEFVIALGVRFKDSVNVSGVTLVAGPSWIDSAKIHEARGDYAAAGYPTTGTYWKDVSPAYGFYKLSSGGNEYIVFIDSIQPSFEVKAGDLLKFRVEYTDGSSEYFIKMINFVFTDIPKMLYYKFGSGDSWTAAPTPVAGVEAPLATATSSVVYLRWSRPKDENGRQIIGGRYTFEYDSSLVGGSVPEVTVVERDDGSGAYVEGYYDFSSLLGAEDSELAMSLCIRDVNNDNASQRVRFTKGW
jgi:hypothetical protein